MPNQDFLPFLRLYGPAWLSENWNDGIVNVWERKRDQAGHHCGDPKCGAIKRSCFKKLHAAFCVVPVPIGNGYWRYCGLRFLVKSPSGCGQHSYAEYDNNHFFRNAVKNMPFKLPEMFPHESPGWEMPVTNSANLRPFQMRMNTIDGKFGYTAVLTSNRAGRELEYRDLGRVPPWELKFASDQDNRAPAEEVEEPTEEERALREVNEQEQNGDLFDTPAPYEHWNDIKSKTKTLENWARKDAKVTTSMPKVTEEPTVQPTQKTSKKKSKSVKNKFKRVLT